MRLLPLRARLALVFALAMAAVIAGMGGFVNARVQRSLNSAVDQGLRSRAAEVASAATQVDSPLSATRTSGGFGQLITPDGHVFDATPGLKARPLLDHNQLARTRRGLRIITVAEVPGVGATRILAEAIRAQDQWAFLVVGASLAPERSALDSLRTGLLIGGPIALLLATLGGYLMAGAALRPVERMRARAAGFSADSHGARLPIPRAEDEIARLGRTLNAMLERLEHARTREHQFLADASHELRTPLTLLKTELELALDEPRSTGELMAALSSSAEEVDRLVVLAEDLLLLAQINQGRLPVRPVAIDAAELAARTAARFSGRARRSGRHLTVSAPEGLWLYLDPLRFEQALGNLLDNALRHGSGEINLDVARSGDAVELDVRDEGPGPPSEFRPRAFERFTRADPARGGAGTGLGLAIVSAIVKAHRGEAVLGAGSQVILRIPGCCVEPGAPPAPEHQPRPRLERVPTH